ncbi:MAG: ABC transporter ATP-binding protein [Chlamydiae bacterium CG10_big_fil_rev_8_21_14_0_10_35_9]|nr:MAG: ABC transporter ATP-binding protein [Chlamydiae bacterium CG10_big_fil_rev_8_21_14_0_10_35_9]
MKYLIEVCNLSKSFYFPKKIDVLKDVSLSIEKGKSAAIMGASGEGKTTLLHLIGSLEKPDCGKVLIKEKEVTSQNCASIRNSLIGFIFQTSNLLEDLTALENVMLPSMIARKNDKLQLKKAYELLDMVGLSNRKHFYAKQLSGGEKQRVAIARAYINNPEIILADEPSGNLDHENATIIHEMLISSCKDFNKTLILVTHNQELASYCDLQYLLKNKQLIISK